MLARPRHQESHPQCEVFAAVGNDVNVFADGLIATMRGWYGGLPLGASTTETMRRRALAAATSCGVHIPQDMDGGPTPIGSPRNQEEGIAQSEAPEGVEEPCAADDGMDDEDEESPQDDNALKCARPRGERPAQTSQGYEGVSFGGAGPLVLRGVAQFARARSPAIHLTQRSALRPCDGLATR